MTVLCLSVPASGCKSAEEKEADAERKKAGAEARKKAEMGVAEHEAACNKDDAVSCAALATAYQVGEDKEADPAKAQELFEKACNLGHGPSCIDAADPYLDKGEDDKARPLLDKGCKAENEDCCTRLAALDDKAKKAAGADPATGAAAEADGEKKEMSDAERLMAEIEAAEKDDG
jgi:TPR repeat protein